MRASASRAIVLPRFLRKPVRALSRIEWQPPRRVGLKALTVLFAATALAGTIIGGHAMTVASAVTAWVGFGIENVKITGQSQTSEVDVLAALDIGTYPSLLTLDVEAAKARIEALPWVQQASLKKLFPDALEISVAERDPYAIWQHDGISTLVDVAGKSITEEIDDRYLSLPRVVGAGAAPRAQEYADLIATAPSIASEARAGVLVSETRWNVLLKSGIEVMLPAERPEAALAVLATLDADHALLKREIAAVDLRQSGELILRLTPEGLEQRKALLKARGKAGKSNT